MAITVVSVKRTAMNFACSMGFLRYGGLSGVTAVFVT